MVEDETLAASERKLWPLNGIDHVEFYVGNAKHAAHFYRTAFGFTPVAYAGPETGTRDRVSYVVEQQGIKLVLTSPLDSRNPIAEHLSRHDDGVKDIAFSVSDAARAFEKAAARGAKPLLEPTTFEDEGGKAVKSAIAAFGDTVHSFIQRDSYSGAFLPGYRAIKDAPPAPSTGLTGIDHFAVGVEPGAISRWGNYYYDVLGFEETYRDDVATDYSGMISKVMQNDEGNVISVLVEPTPGKRKSPIDEYLNYYGCSGVHHIALATDDIVRTVGALRANGVEFTTTPGAYYDNLEKRCNQLPRSIEKLRDLHILVDWDEWGCLLQIFSKPVQSRPTFFFEIIQRIGARGFGSGNIRALFEAIERDQSSRGNV